ncbi:MAG: FMN-binding protein [Gammaproteobacteria bacterium]|nr:FMN-binding protein [Gammaproteobacteria bacterium]MCB1871635.1 FMN-binding protein [Gammaproteobacteria bacterium]
MSSSQNINVGKRDLGSAKLVATLSFAGLLSGLIIVLAYESTLPTITAHKAMVMKEAVFKVLPGVNRMQRLVYRNGMLAASEQVRKDDEVIFSGYDASGRLVGYAIAGAGPGFQDTIRLLYGYIPETREITGMEILESRETPGLGDKIYKDPAFVANFDSLSIDPEIRAVKKGKRSAANEIDAITGATISSKAVVRIINEANRLWLLRIEQAVKPEGKG